MKRELLALGIVGAVFATVAPVAAFQRGHGSGPKPGSSSGAQAVKAPKPAAVKTQGPKSHPAKVQSPKTKVQSPKTNKTTGGAKATVKRSETPSAKKTVRTASSTTTLSPVQLKLQRNTKLADKLATRLPANADVMTAAEGFRNLGQFVAAVNVSNNLGIPFDTLKSRMVDDHMSLGQAIQDVRPQADSRTEARRAEQQATVIIDSTEGSVSTTSRKAKRRPSGGQ